MKTRIVIFNTFFLGVGAFFLASLVVAAQDQKSEGFPLVLSETQEAVKIASLSKDGENQIDIDNPSISFEEMRIVAKSFFGKADAPSAPQILGAVDITMNDPKNEDAKSRIGLANEQLLKKAREMVFPSVATTESASVALPREKVEGEIADGISLVDINSEDVQLIGDQIRMDENQNKEEFPSDRATRLFQQVAVGITSSL